MFIAHREKNNLHFLYKTPYSSISQMSVPLVKVLLHSNQSVLLIRYLKN